MSKHTNLALRIDNMLLIISFTRSSDPVGVTTSPGYTMLLPAIVIRVQLGSDFWGADFTDNRAERDFFSSFNWNVLTFDDKEGVGSCNSFFIGAVFAFAYALA